MTRLVLDVDTGIDDTLALCYLLASPEAELMGVVGTYGNVTARDSVRNNHAVLRLFGREDIPVMLGCEAPSWADLFEVDEGCARFHGANGLGNVDPACYLPDDDAAEVGESRDDTNAAHDAACDGAADVRDDRASAARPSVAAFRDRLTKSVGGERVDVATTAADAALADAAAASREGDGVRFIVDAVRKHGRDVTIVATGPLTDVDAAIRLAPDIVPNLRLVIMGGSLTQEGNCYDLICETNIFQDPEAANRVFRSGADVTMIGLDVTHQCLMTRADADRWRATGTRRGAFLADMVRFYINANEASDPIFLAGSPLHDPLAAAVSLDPTLVGLFDVNMMTETATGNGHGFRGRTIGDPTRLREPRKTAHVALTVDAPRFTARFRDRLAGLCAA
ncbi:nucleoside hydrolase [Bifidobacterium sp. 82T10]|uniref:Nucleoside hydrolase n=1 Tax=Bifidobacterium miconis TaxID=2834435 RepID=A0ABS6WE48_9BIFI|nr:nucleoside hydrolase [Bifidobacterium miconis]MBW3092222.1 nucleoside hydrolase [Bifidobacterium miconis]